MKRSNKGKDFLAKSPKSSRRKKQNGPSCSREPEKTKDASRKKKQPTREKNKKKEDGKRNQVTLITNYYYIISYFSYRRLGQNVYDKSQYCLYSLFNLVCNENGGFLT